MKSIDVLPIQIFQSCYNQNKILNSFVEQKAKVFIDKDSDVFYPKSLDFEFNELPEDFGNFIKDSIEEFLFCSLKKNIQNVISRNF